MHMLEVGKLYNPKRTRWPKGAQLQLTTEGAELLLLFGSPTSAEIQDARKGVPQWGWISGENIGLLLFRLGTQPWSEAPFQAHRQAEPVGVPSSQLSVTLVDAHTGIIKSLRLLAWSEEFTTEVRRNVESQLSRPSNDLGAQAELDGWFSRETAVLAREHATVKC